MVHNGKKTCSGKIPEPKKDENLILDLLGYYDAEQVITDIARKEADLDTLKAGASLIPVAKITKVPKVVKAIGNVGKTRSKKGKEGEKIAKSGQVKQTKARDKGGSSTTQKQNPTKGESEVWKNLDNVKGQDRKTSGTGRNKKYYEWDHTHNDIEVYDRKGNHLGSMDPTTGEMYKPAVPGRKIDVN